MKTYLITYNLLFGESSPYYTAFNNKIKSYQYWAKPLPNIWLVKTNTDLQTIINYLKTDLFKGDKLLIIEVNNNWISLNLDPDVVKWMQGGL